MKIRSVGGYFGDESSQETPNEQTTTYEYADGAIMEFATRGGFTNDEAGVRIGNIFYGTKGWLWIEEAGKSWQSYFGPKNEPSSTGARKSRYHCITRRASFASQKIGPA